MTNLFITCCTLAQRRAAVVACAALLSAATTGAAEEQRVPPSPPAREAPAVPSGGADFMFGAPRAWIGMRGSYLVPRAGGDLFTFVSDQLTLKGSDFRTRGVAGDVGIVLSPRFDIVAGFDRTRREQDSEYRHFVASNGTPIAQKTRLGQVTLSTGLRVSPLGRGRALSRYAFIPRRVVPYVGAGATLGFYSFTQQGQFVDAGDRGIFSDSFVSDGWSFGPYAHGGVDVQLWKQLFLTMDARYTWLHGSLSSDFSGFDGIDLAGFRGGTGISIVF